MTTGEKQVKAASVHQGHRARMKERLRQEGLGSFADHQVLELLLFYAIPQRDTNELAHRLLRHRPKRLRSPHGRWQEKAPF